MQDAANELVLRNRILVLWYKYSVRSVLLRLRAWTPADRRCDGSGRAGGGRNQSKINRGRPMFSCSHVRLYKPTY